MTMVRSAGAALVCSLLLSLARAGDAAPMRSYAVVDPVLNMTAWTLAVPAGWSASGTMLPPPSCNTGTTPIYKATSADGRTGAYFLPRADWAWGPGVSAGNDCLSFTRPLSATEFLAYQLRTDGIGYVRTLAPPPGPSLGPGWMTDTARVLGRYVVGQQTYDTVVTATVMCREQTMPYGTMHACSALTKRWFGPIGMVLEAIPQFEALKMTLNQEWMSAWTAAMVQHTRQLYARETQALLHQGDLAQAARMQEHDRFMAAQQQAADLRSMRFNEHEFTKQRNNDNFVDYVLDCTRFYNSSGTFRVSGTNCPNRQTF